MKRQLENGLMGNEMEWIKQTMNSLLLGVHGQFNVGIEGEN